MLKDIELIVCINLDRRPDRWDAFQKQCPASILPRVQRWSAIDGNVQNPAEWWRGSRGAWGCYLSHLSVIHSCAVGGIKSVLIFEDDIIPVDDFENQLAAFERELPADWQIVYLGGTLRDSAPRLVTPNVCVPLRVATTHAYAVREPSLTKLDRDLQNVQVIQHHAHVDHFYERHHRMNRDGLYVPSRWLFDQGNSFSDVQGVSTGRFHWENPIDIPPRRLVPRPQKCDIQEIELNGHKMLQCSRFNCRQVQAGSTTPDCRVRNGLMWVTAPTPDEDAA